MDSFACSSWFCWLFLHLRRLGSRHGTGSVRDAAEIRFSEAVLELRSLSGGSQYSVRTSAIGSFVFCRPLRRGTTNSLSAPRESVSSPRLGRNRRRRRSNGWDRAVVSGKGSGSPRSYWPGEQIARPPQASGGEHLSKGEVSSLPLNSRDFSKLLLLAAGTMTDANGAANFTQQFCGQRPAWHGHCVRHRRRRHDTDRRWVGATFSKLQRRCHSGGFSPNSGVLPAEIGHGGASFTNVVTRSGTKDLHGSVFEFVPQRSPGCPQLLRSRGLGSPPHPPLHSERIWRHHRRSRDPSRPSQRPYFSFSASIRASAKSSEPQQVFPVPTAEERLGIDTITYRKPPHLPEIRFSCQ